MIKDGYCISEVTIQNGDKQFESLQTIMGTTTAQPQSQISVQLERRRKALRMSFKVLALRSGVSLPTVQRILRNGGEGFTYAKVAAVARSLGMDFELKCTSDEQTFAEQQARAKAGVIVRMVQGTSALESQAVDSETRQQMLNQTVHELMAGPRRKLWNPM
jgi:transcriptional regulator with XRE-family HTH domain